MGALEAMTLSWELRFNTQFVWLATIKPSIIKTLQAVLKLRLGG
jgi:hypothetical protein